MMMTKTTTTMAALTAALLVAGCATYTPRAVQPGQASDEVLALMGPPTSRYAAAGGGQRWEYARGPFGKHTYMVDFDPASKVQGWQQVLTEPNFNTVAAGLSRNELLYRLGRPSERRGGGWQRGEVWSYRYDSLFCTWFQVSLDDAGVVTGAGYGPDPMCEAKENVSWAR